MSFDATPASQTDELYARALFAAAPHPIIVLDDRWLLRDASPAVNRILGFPPDQLIGCDVRTVIHPDDLPRVFMLRRAILREPQRDHTAIVRVRDRQGGWRSLDLTATNQLAHPLIRGVLIHARDVTIRAVAEAEVRQQAAQAETLVRSAARLSANLDRSAVIATICEEAMLAFSADAACVVFPDQPLTAPQLVIRMAYGNDLVEVIAAAAHDMLGQLRSCTDPVVVQHYAAAAVAGKHSVPHWTIAGAYMSRADQRAGALLVIFHEAERTISHAERALLRGLADQAGLALDNADLLADLQTSNAALAAAYDATLEGWVRALDLRDKETEGHTRRVTAMTVRLARAMGFNEEELVHIRRGALLHDIGKLVLPDRILHKPSPLDAEEWALMRRHPVFAYEWLSPIGFLRPALDIPYCHHERWDGVGYPRGLCGAEIPLAARVFAVVDAWDAIRSERPYKPSIPHHQAVQLIAVEAGSQFDPEVVRVFLSLIAGYSNEERALFG